MVVVGQLRSECGETRVDICTVAEFTHTLEKNISPADVSSAKRQPKSRLRVPNLDKESSCLGAIP